jgi:hypothetical protein
MKAFCAVLIALFVLSKGAAMAGSVTDAEKAKVEAYQKYYDERRKLGPNPDPKELHQLRARTIYPAEQKVQSTFLEKVDEVQKNVRRNAYNALLKILPADLIPAWILNPFTKNKTVAASGAKSNALPQAVPAVKASPMPEAQPTKEIVILDGSGIEKEIDFQKRSTKPSTRP